MLLSILILLIVPGVVVLVGFVTVILFLLFFTVAHLVQVLFKLVDLHAALKPNVFPNRDRLVWALFLKLKHWLRLFEDAFGALLIASNESKPSQRRLTLVRILFLGRGLVNSMAYLSSLFLGQELLSFGVGSFGLTMLKM